jgi:RNA polymerase sigma-70 factor (ECF subfamily)
LEAAVSGDAPEVSAEATADLVGSYQPVLVRLATFYGAEESEIERILIEAWRTALQAQKIGSEGFISALFRDLMVRVRTLEAAAQREPEPTVEADRFEPEDSRWAGWFTADPPSFAVFDRGGPAEAEARVAAAEALSRLPFGQRVVVVMRDVAGWSPDEVTKLLGIDDARQRALLHSGRGRVRRSLQKLAGAMAGG